MKVGALVSWDGLGYGKRMGVSMKGLTKIEEKRLRVCVFVQNSGRPEVSCG